MLLSPRYRELVLFKTYANLCSEASRTYLSFLWWVFDPILSMGVYYIVFGLLLKRGTDDYVPFLIIGITTWQWFAFTIIHGMKSIIENKGLMEQVHLPKIVFPSIIILMDTFKFLIVLSLVLVFLWIYGFKINIKYLSLPLVLGIQFLINASFTYFLAAIIPFLPDLMFVVSPILQLAFFLSGVIYAGDTIPVQFRMFFYLNPMATLIESYRNILMYDKWPDWNSLGIIFIIAVLGIYLSHRLIQHFDYIYPRIVLR